MKKDVSKYFILLLLLFLFAAPGIAAYLFYQHPSWLGAARTNKGTLLNPPIVFSTLQGREKWRIIFWSPGVCNKLCLQQLDSLARIRLALGRKLYQVDQWIILGEHAPSLSENQLVLLKDMDFKVGRLPPGALKTKDNVFSEPRIFIADPNKYLVLSYASEVNPEDVYKDLKLLLNTTTNKSG